MNEYYYGVGMIKAHEWVVANIPAWARVIICIILFALLCVCEYYKENKK